MSASRLVEDQAAVSEPARRLRELVRSWAASSESLDAAVRNVNLGDLDTWRALYDGFAQPGRFGVACPRGARWCGQHHRWICSAMIEEAAAALVPGPVATTALATLVADDPAVLLRWPRGSAARAWRCESGITLLRPGTAIRFGEMGSRCRCRRVSRCCLPVTAGSWSTSAADGVGIEPLQANGFLLPAAAVSTPTFRHLPQQLAVPARRVPRSGGLSVLAAEAAGLALLGAGHRDRIRQGA